jgi:hypothetical protein
MTSAASAGSDEAVFDEEEAEAKISFEGILETLTSLVCCSEAVKTSLGSGEAGRTSLGSGEASRTSVIAVHVLIIPQPNIMLKQTYKYVEYDVLLIV